MDTAKLVTFGRGGDTVYLGQGSTCQGYGSPDRPHAAEPRDGRAFLDGLYAIDTRAAVETKAGIRMAISGPMVGVDLPDGEIDRCPEPSDLMFGAMLADTGNAYGTLLVAQKAARTVAPTAPGPLDSVPVSEYVRLWRAAGARIGQYRNGKIVWES